METRKNALSSVGAERIRLIDSLIAHLEPTHTPDEEAPVRATPTVNRTDCLNYPAAVSMGLPIGSGLIESGHRHVLHARLKKALPGCLNMLTTLPNYAFSAPTISGTVWGTN